VNLPTASFFNIDALDVASIRERVAAQARASYVVEGLLEAGSLVILAGEPKAGKSVFVTHLAVAIASGSKWLSRSTSQGGVLWLAYEESYQERLRTLEQHRGVDSLPILTWFRPQKLDTEVGMPMLRSAIRRHSPSVVVIDSLIPAYDDPDFEHAGAARSKVQRLKDLAEDEGVLILVIHHLNKSHGSAKFSSDPIACSHQIAATASAHWIIRSSGYQEDGSRSIQLIANGREIGQKEIFIESGGRADFRVVEKSSRRQRAVGELIESRLRNHLKGCPVGSTQDEMKRELKCSLAAVSKALKNLGENGEIKIEIVGRTKVYQLRNASSAGDMLTVGSESEPGMLRQAG
jgi:KaiC/GvpD/RAD55 family RecA-like ATPase